MLFRVDLYTHLDIIISHFGIFHDGTPLKGLRWIGEFTLNRMVPSLYAPSQAQNFEIIDSKIKTLCTGSYIWRREKKNCFIHQFWKKVTTSAKQLYKFEIGTLPLSNGIMQNIRSLTKNQHISMYMLKNVQFSAA